MHLQTEILSGMVMVHS